MSISTNPLSTGEFAKKAGVSTSTVSKWLRDGKIRGEKKKGRWVISESELAGLEKEPQAGPGARSPKASDQVLTIEQFSAMTYLTEFGVRKWLKQGRLKPAVDPSGNAGVDAANLENPLIKRLVR